MKVLGYILSILLLIIFFTAFVFLIKYTVNVSKQTKIKAEFTDLTPFSKKMPVYFKGFKIGKVTKIVPKEDFTSTLLYITLYPEKLSLPQNVVLQVRSYRRNITYGEIILPDVASVKRLKTGDVIEGRTNLSFNEILERQAENGSFDLMFANIADFTTNLNIAVQELDGFVKDIRRTFRNNESYISVSTRNFSQATSHLTRASVNISSSVDQATLDRTMKNLEATSYNLKNITENVDCATRNLSDTMDNINGITDSVNSTLKQRFGGFRLFFGKPRGRGKYGCRSR